MFLLECVICTCESLLELDNIRKTYGSMHVLALMEKGDRNGGRDGVVESKEGIWEPWLGEGEGAYRFVEGES